MTRSLKRPLKPQIRTLLSEFSSRLGNEILNVRIYHDHETFVCERQVVEQDGTSFTMVFPFKELSAARTLFAADPYYSRVRGKVGRALIRLNNAARGFHGTSTS